MSLCDATCRSCIYSTVLSTFGVVCNYILVTGNRRGCAAGRGCERKIAGDHAITIDELLYRGQMPEQPKKEKDKRNHGQYRYNPEQKKGYHKRNQELLAGRQREPIVRFCKEHKVTYAQIADVIGTSATTVQYWAKEYTPARWDKLAALGIEKPEGL